MTELKGHNQKYLCRIFRGLMGNLGDFDFVMPCFNENLLCNCG